jgi:hypothetical protein
MQPSQPEDSSDVASVSAALEATRELLKLTREQLAEARERETRLLAIVESQAGLPERKPSTRKTLRIWVAALGLIGLTAAGALWWWQATRATATEAPPAAQVAPPASTTPPIPKPDEGSTAKTRPRKKLPPVPHPGEVRIPGGATNWCWLDESTGSSPADRT